MYTTHDLCFEINKNECTAKIALSPNAEGNIIIPRSIKIDSQEFLITSIGKHSFKSNSKIKSISFSENSELHTIEEEAFDESSLESLFLPSKLQELKESWCKRTLKLNHISISPKNSLYIYINNEFIATFSDKSTNIYDVILFSRRNITTISIPSDIKQIAADSFSYCSSLKSVKFSADSKITIIGKSSFSYSAIESISIPSSVTEIKESAFSYCRNLKKINFPIDSKLISIETNTFASTKIQNIIIPSSVTEINPFAFYGSSIKKVEFQKDSKLLFIGKSAFADSELQSISIPSSLEEIGECAFYCTNIRRIEFPVDSSLEIIESSAFQFSRIETILLPSKLAKLNESAFENCENLIAVEFNGERISINENCFCECGKLIAISLPNAKEIFIDESSLSGISSDFSLFTCNFAEFSYHDIFE